MIKTLKKGNLYDNMKIYVKGGAGDGDDIFID